MNLLAYWGVFKSQRRIVLIGVSVTLALAASSVVSVSPSGVALRSPRVYLANSTLFLRQATPSGKGAGAPYEAGQLEYLAGIYAQLASGDQVRQMVDPRRNRNLQFQVGTLKGDQGSPLPMLSVSAFATSPAAAAKDSALVAGALQRYIVADQGSRRIEVPIVERPRPPLRRSTRGFVSRDP